MRCPLRLLVFVAALSGPPVSAAGMNLSAGWVHDDNVSGSATAGVADDALTASWSMASRRVLARDWQLETGASLTADDWLKWHGLDQLVPAVRGGLIRKFGFGPYAPRLEATGTAEYRYRHYAGARGLAVAGGLAFRQRLTPSLAWSAEGRFDDFAARDAIYSGRGRTLRLQLDADFTPAWHLTLAARRRLGDMNGHFRGPSPLGDSLFGPAWTTTRYSGSTNGFTASLARAWGTATTLGAQFDYASTRGNGRLYLNRITSLTLVHAF